MIHQIKTTARILILSLIFISNYVISKEINNSHFDSKTYHENSQIQNKWALDTINTLSFTGNEVILDIGSGDGSVTAFLSTLVPKGKVIGIDTSKDMTHFASKQFSKTAYPNLDFKQQSATNFKLNQPCDLIVSFSVLHWVSDLDNVFKRIHENLKPNGKFILYFGPDFGENRLDHIIEHVATSPKWNANLSTVKSGFYLATPQAINQLILQSNLKPESLIILRIHETFKNATAFKTWLKAALPHLNYLPQNQHDEFMNDIVKEYVQFYPSDKDGTFHYYDYMIKVVGINS